MIGYGSEIWCLDSIKPGRTVTGSLVVAQALYRRFTTPRGTLRGLDDPDSGDEESIYGFDLAEYIGRTDADAAVASLPAIIAAEACKDDRVVSVAATADATQDAAGNVAILVIMQVTLAKASNNFTLTLSVSAAGVVLLGVT